MSSRPEQRKRRSTATKPLASRGVPYKAVLAATLDPIITIDSAGVIQSASDSVERVFGWTPIELVGMNVSILMPEPHHSAHDAYLAKYHETGRSEHLNRARRFEAVHKDGTLFPIEVSVSRVDIPGEAAPLFVGIIRDLSDHGGDKVGAGVEGGSTKSGDNTRLHELLAEQTAALHAAHLRLRMADRLASIGALAAGLGHDMNNVLLPVRAHLEAARTMTMKPGVRDHIDAVHKSVTYLQHLADGLHFLARDTDGEDCERSSTDLGVWWSQVGPLLTKAVPKGVKVTVSLPTGLPELGVSAHGLTQAVLNLIVNAGEAIPADRKRPQGHVRVWAEVTKSGTEVRLCITDNGLGMSAEVQRNALEMFYTTKSRGFGTGLGLPLVARVISRAGGSLQIESKPGNGTTVAISLPVTGMGGQAGRASQALRAMITLTDGRAAALIQHLLEVAGVQVAPGSDPTGADIWILEPTEAGFAAAKAWRTRHPHGRLVLVCKADSGPSHAWSALHAVTIEDCNDLDAIGAALSRTIVGS
jgi:PAS domain S-box-containing protein